MYPGVPWDLKLCVEAKEACERMGSGVREDGFRAACNAAGMRRLETLLDASWRGVLGAADGFTGSRINRATLASAVDPSRSNPSQSDPSRLDPSRLDPSRLDPAWRT